MYISIWSLPLRERGLKFPLAGNHPPMRHVAPFTGAWIEIWAAWTCPAYPPVAPFTGAWIEIANYCSRLRLPVASLPLRERGLKLDDGDDCGYRRQSLPLRERGLKCQVQGLRGLQSRRSLYGSVD